MKGKRKKIKKEKEKERKEKQPKIEDPHGVIFYLFLEGVRRGVMEGRVTIYKYKGARENRRETSGTSSEKNAFVKVEKIVVVR